MLVLSEIENKVEVRKIIVNLSVNVDSTRIVWSNVPKEIQGYIGTYDMKK